MLSLELVAISPYQENARGPHCRFRSERTPITKTHFLSALPSDPGLLR